MEYAQIALQVALGISLSACAGLRAFLPILVIGVLTKLGYVQVGSSFQWIAGTPALIIFGTATVVEIAADKVPVLDNFLDSIGVFIKPAAGTVLFSTVVAKFDPLIALTLGLIVGGSISELVHHKKAFVRAGSTMFTAGTGNGFLSALEDVAAMAGTALAVAAPYLAAVLAIFLIIISYFAVKQVSKFITKIFMAFNRKKTQ
ncbi:MAG: DUF4126 domain-containing protein [Firmicutes bacterium]|nr:DUF4126 domain-containing protein [Bacillota bacterium]